MQFIKLKTKKNILLELIFIKIMSRFIFKLYQLNNIFLIYCIIYYLL